MDMRVVRSIGLSVLTMSLMVGTAAAQSTMTIPFAPTKVNADCVKATQTAGKLLGKSAVGKTKKNEFLTVGTMYYTETLVDPGLGVNYTDAKLAVECRGDGTIRLVENCGNVAVATIVCTTGARPSTGASTSFAVTNDRAFDVQVQADPDSILEWSNPRLIVY